MGACTSGQVVEPDSSIPDDAPGPDTFVAPIDALVVDTPPVPPVMQFGDRAGAIPGTFFETFLDDGSPANNMGNHDDLHLTADLDDPVLVRVDITAVPTYATVTSAKLRFIVTSDSIPAGTQIDIFKMNESWTEGTGDYSPGVANNTERNPGVAWSAAGARPPSRSATPVASTTVGETVDTGDELELALPAALVMEWIANPSTNYGVAIIVASSSSFYCEFSTSEESTAALRPILELALE